MGGQTWRTGKLAMGEGRSSKGEHMVMVWWEGMQCETHREDLSGGEQKTHCSKKRFIWQKIQQKKKMKKVISMVLTGIDPSSLWRQI